jgi:hypothetical protein
VHAIMLCYDACAPVVNFCICGQGKGGGASKKRKKGDGDGGSSSRADMQHGKSKAGKCNASAEVDVAEQSAEEEFEWRTEGSAYLGRKFARKKVDADGIEHIVQGKITGWVSADDYSDDEGSLVALWRFEPFDQKYKEEAFKLHEVEAMHAKVRMRLCFVFLLMW